MSAFLEIPTRSDLTHYKLSVDLDGKSFTIELRWSPRASAWFMALGDAEGTPLLTGIRVVVDTFFFSRYRDASFPLGDIFAYDTSSQQEDPGETDLGRRVMLLYLSGVT